MCYKFSGPTDTLPQAMQGLSLKILLNFLSVILLNIWCILNVFHSKMSIIFVQIKKLDTPVAFWRSSPTWRLQCSHDVMKSQLQIMQAFNEHYLVQQVMQITCWTDRHSKSWQNSLYPKLAQRECYLSELHCFKAAVLMYMPPIFNPVSDKFNFCGQ